MNITAIRTDEIRIPTVAIRAYVHFLTVTLLVTAESAYMIARLLHTVSIVDGK